MGHKHDAPINHISRPKVKMLILDGWTDEKIATFFGYTKWAYYEWRQRNKKFVKQCSDWRAQAARNVERNLFKRAKGFRYEEVELKKVPIRGKDGKRKFVTIEIKKNKKTMVGSVEAAKFLLTNYMPDKYKNRSDVKNMNMSGQMDDTAFRDKFFGIVEPPKVEADE